MPIVEIVTAGLSDLWTTGSECAGPHHRHMAVPRARILPHHDCEFSLIGGVLRLLRRTRMETKLGYAMIPHPIDPAVDVDFAGMLRSGSFDIAGAINPMRNFSPHGATDVPREDIAVSVPVVGQITRVVADGKLIDQLRVDCLIPLSWCICERWMVKVCSCHRNRSRCRMNTVINFRMTWSWLGWRRRRNSWNVYLLSDLDQVRTRNLLICLQ